MNLIAKPATTVVHTISAAVLMVMMLLTGADVTLRYVLNSPIPGSMELTEFMMVITVALGLAYCALHKGHVGVDIVVSRLRGRARALMNSIASFAFLGLFILITWRSVERARALIDTHVTSNILYIPVFPFVLVLTAGCAILCLVLLRDFLDYLLQVLTK